MTDKNRPEMLGTSGTGAPGALGVLERLFATARDSQPDFGGDNFTKIVLNRLPAHPVRARQKRFYPDIFGLLVGLLAAISVIKPTQIATKLVSLLPGTVSISLSSILVMSAVLSTLALIAWWSVERGSRT